MFSWEEPIHGGALRQDRRARAYGKTKVKEDPSLIPDSCLDHTSICPFSIHVLFTMFSASRLHAKSIISSSISLKPENMRSFSVWTLVTSALCERAHIWFLWATKSCMFAWSAWCAGTLEALYRTIGSKSLTCFLRSTFGRKFFWRLKGNLAKNLFTPVLETPASSKILQAPSSQSLYTKIPRRKKYYNWGWSNGRDLAMWRPSKEHELWKCSTVLGKRYIILANT